MNEPTDEQINRTIAEWMGCTVVETNGGIKGWRLLTSNGGTLAFSLRGPDELWKNFRWYTTSHDACHEALERMTDDQLDDYSYELYTIVDPDGYEPQVNALMARASAHHKALAIYRVVKGVS